MKALKKTFPLITQREIPIKVYFSNPKNIFSFIAGITHAKQLEKCNSDVINNLNRFIKK